MLCSTLQWCHNGRDSVLNHQPYDCLLNRLFRRRSKKPSKLRLTGLCVGNSPGTGEFPAQMASNAKNVSIWWCHHDMTRYLHRYWYNRVKLNRNTYISNFRNKRNWRVWRPLEVGHDQRSYVGHVWPLGHIWASGNAQIGAKSSNFRLVWPWNLRHRKNALLLYNFKLSAPFRSHGWIQTGVTVRKRRIQIKIGDFLSCPTSKFDGWSWKNNRAPLLCDFKLCASFHNHRWIQTGVTVRKCSNWGKICFDLCDADFWPLNLTFRVDIPSVNGNYFWKFHDDTLTGTWWIRCDGRTDGEADGRTDRTCWTVHRSAWS